MNETETTWKVKGLFKANAQSVANEISDIGDDVSPAEIVEKARNENTELHKCFEWDDAIAGEKYRLSQARQIVCNLVYVPRKAENAHPPVRLFYKTQPSSGYKPTKLIMRNVDEYKSLLDRATNELTTFRNKYKTLAELENVMDTIDDFIG